MLQLKGWRKFNLNAAFSALFYGCKAKASTMSVQMWSEYRTPQILIHLNTRLFIVWYSKDKKYHVWKNRPKTRLFVHISNIFDPVFRILKIQWLEGMRAFKYRTSPVIGSLFHTFVHKSVLNRARALYLWLWNKIQWDLNNKLVGYSNGPNLSDH